MSEFVYRFRSIEKLLEFKELEQQTIYFSPPHDLNDPIEDFKDIVWNGDSVLWKNHLRHYLLCLQHIYVLIRLLGEDEAFGVKDIPVFTTFGSLPTPIYKEKMKKLFLEFFGNETIKILIEGLSSRENVRKDEFLFYLESIHPYCLSLIHKHDDSIEESKRKNASLNFLEKSITSDFFKLINSAKEELKEVDNPESVLFSIAQQVTQESKLLNVLQNKGMGNNKKLYFLDFPRLYLRKLEEIMFWPWYTACFSKTPNNSSMWGYYTDGHRGVCLKFKTTKDQDRHGIHLKTITSIGGSKGKIKKNYSDVLFPLYDISYESKVKPIEFFKTIGRLPYPALIDQWYSDEENKISPLVQDVLKGQEEWRKSYWKAFYDNIPIKTQEWKHEEECRLIQTSLLNENIPSEDRVLKYRFSDLDGVIFGINMTEENKIRVIKILHTICIKENRFDLNFYQARYNNHTGKVDIHILSMLKFIESENSGRKKSKS